MVGFIRLLRGRPADTLLWVIGKVAEVLSVLPGIWVLLVDIIGGGPGGD